MKLNEITIEVTKQCPNNCIYCSSLSDIGQTEALSQTIIYQVIDDAKELGAASVSLSGGEPFLRADIADIVNYIHKRGLRIRIYTSGLCYEDDHYTPISQDQLKSISGNIESLIFNYEAISQELYATIVGTIPANLSLLEESIKRALALGIRVEAHLVPMHGNFRQIPDVLKKLYSIGVTNVSLLRLVPQGRVLDNKELILLNENEHEELKQILVACKETYKDKIRLGLPFSAKRAACGTGTVKLTVRYDGYVFPCEAFKDGMMELKGCISPENVKEKRLQEIYESSAYLRLIREGLNTFSQCESEEHCYGQYCRMT